jgi:hypothetical protein
MAKDRVHPLKLEDSPSGGVELDPYPTGLDPNEDYVDVHGITFQDATSNDEDVSIERDDSGNLVLTDKISGIWKLSDLSGGGLTEITHPAVRQLIHFVDNGPAEGFASGAYREITGTVFPTAVIWYDQAGVGKKKIVEKLITWTGATPTTIVWKVYDAAEVLIATLTDTITYSGMFETSRARTITVA